jgi:hypothetical protein
MRRALLVRRGLGGAMIYGGLWIGLGDWMGGLSVIERFDRDDYVLMFAIIRVER